MEQIPKINIGCTKTDDEVLEDFIKEYCNDAPGQTRADAMNVLRKLADPYGFCYLYLQYKKTWEHCIGMNERQAQELLFPLVHELNKLGCGYIQIRGNVGNKTLLEYESELLERKIRRAESFNWDLWDIKNVYARHLHKAIPEHNGKVYKKDLLQCLDELMKADVIYDYHSRDIYESFNGEKLSYFRPGYRVRGKKGNKYIEVK